MRPLGSPEALEKRRLRAIKLIKQRFMPVDIARMLGVDRRSVRRWKAAYLAKGQGAVQAKPAPGRPPRLGKRDKSRLERLLLKGASAAGFATDLWTCPRVAKLIHHSFGVRYHVDHVCRLLHGMGWSPQRPARVAVERDESLIQHWLKVEWPSIKKKHAG